MYLEVARAAGVQAVIAAGYVGSFVKDVPIGSLFVPTAAIADDGTTRAYGLGSGPFAADPALTHAVLDSAKANDVASSTGTIASIDAIMLEDDAMLDHYRQRGASAIDMETGCLFALAQRLGLRAAAVHIVSDNAANRDIDPEGKHVLSIRTQLQAATAALYKETFAEDSGVRKGKGERRKNGTL
jgi:purine-nucleoside phosphorylase